MRRLAMPLLVVLLALGLAVPAAQAAPPPIRHVFLIILENKGFDNTFGPKSDAPYLSKTLAAKGQLMSRYYGIGHSSLDNYVAMVSGQGPNPQTQGDCPIFTEFLPGVMGPDDQALGQGCVYPAHVRTVADQLEAKGLTWKGYMEDMGNDPNAPKTCRHPEIGGPDETESARLGDQYAGRHNPFIYFHSIIDRPSCAANDVPLDRMPADLRKASTTASYNFITPNLCNDAHDGPCVDGRPGKLKAANEFLKLWVPRILDSPGYKEGGLLIVTFDEAGSDASACCGETQGPNTPNNGGLNQGPGGGLTGAVAISQYIRPGSVNATPYNHYSLLRSTEDLFGLGHLGFASRAGLVPFGSDVYGRPEGESRASAGRPRLRVSVRPRRARLHRRVVFRFRVTTLKGRKRVGVRGARIRLAHFGRVRTGRGGRAKLTYRITGRAGVRRVSASRRGYRTGRARVRVVR